jgi:hypothetical protein
MGLFQVMPDTLAAVAPECMGRVPTRSEFLADAGMQRAIVGCYWGEVMPQIEVQTSDLNQLMSDAGKLSLCGRYSALERPEAAVDG